MTTALAIAANSIDMKPLSLRDSVFGVVVKMPLCSSGVLLRGTFGGEYTGGTDTGRYIYWRLIHRSREFYIGHFADSAPTVGDLHAEEQG